MTAEREDFSKPSCVNIIVEFQTNATQVHSSIDGKMQPILEYLMKYPQARLAITGHTDNVGSDAYNMELSKRRAESVKKYLVEKYNIDEQRLID